MKKLKEDLANTIIINKSKFITNLFSIKSEDEINEKLKEIRKKYYDATHNVYAYILDDGKKQKCSDDGEPQGTAGKPTLDVLIKNDLTDILAITTRYFGGIKLGAGGLTRAYSNSVSEALENATLIDKVTYERYLINLTYPTYNRISDFLHEYQIFRETFSNDVSIIIGINKNQVNIFKEQIKNLTLGKLVISYIDDIEI